MNVAISSRKRFVFFRTELRAEITALPERPLKEIAAAAGELFSAELPQLQSQALRNLDGLILTNLRGRPGASSQDAEEDILLIEGTAPRFEGAEQDDRTAFRLAITTKFESFVGKDIRYTVKLRSSSGLEIGDQSLADLCRSTALEFTKVQLSLDYFQPRTFSFLGIRLPDLQERFLFESSDSSRLELENTDFNGSFSGAITQKVKACERLFHAPVESELLDSLKKAR